MGTLPTGTGLLRMIHSRVSWMLRPVDRSMMVSAPQRVAQSHLLHLFLDAGGDGGVADVGVDLHQEVASDDHRLRFRVIDVGRYDGAAGGNLVADKFRRHHLGKIRAERHRLFAAHEAGVDVFLPAHVLTNGDVFHLGRYDAPLRVVHLANVLAGLGAAGVANVAEPDTGQGP